MTTLQDLQLWRTLVTGSFVRLLRKSNLVLPGKIKSIVQLLTFAMSMTERVLLMKTVQLMITWDSTAFFVPFSS
jgi:hypothetical protein